MRQFFGTISMKLAPFPVLTGVLVLCATVSFATGARSQTEVPGFKETLEDLRQARQHRLRAIELWRHGKETEAVAEARALVGLRPKLNNDRLRFDERLASIKEANQRLVPNVRQQLPQGFLEIGNQFDQEVEFALSAEDVAGQELMAHLEEARGRYEGAREAWQELARIKSERLGLGHWQVDEARHEAGRLDRLVALRPERHRLIERGGGATAMLTLAAGNKGVGSAFCVDPRGYFVTSTQVVNETKRGQKTIRSKIEGPGNILVGTETTIENEEFSPMNVVLHAGRRDELSLSAKVIGVRDDLGLALLKVRPSQPLPHLEPASLRTLVEGTWACALGYPLRSREVNRGPSVSRSNPPQFVPVLRADPTQLASLHRARGKPWLITLDTEFPQIGSGGLTGGPVLDEKGEVIGMMVEGLSATGTHYVVPALKLVEFLGETREQADVLFDPPPVVFRERKSPIDWTFEVAHWNPLPSSTVVEVVFEGAAAQRRVFRASPTKEGLFTARVTPVDPRDPNPIDVLVPGSDVPVRIVDREVAIGVERLRLSDVRRLESQPARGFKADGRPFAGPVAGLGSLKGLQGPNAVEVDPGAAKSLTLLYPPRNLDPIPFEIVVRAGDKVLGKLRSTISLREPNVEVTGPNALKSVGPRGATQAVRPPTIAIGDAQMGAAPMLRVFTFPGAYHLYCSAFAPNGRTCAFGGDGNQIHIIDVTSGAKLRTLQQDSVVSGLGFTQDGRTLIAGYRDKRIVSWDLSKGQATQVLEDRSTGLLSRSLLTPDSRGVLSEHVDGNLRLWDLGTGKLVRTIASPSTTALAISPEGHRLLLSNAALRLLDLSADRTLWSLDLPNGPTRVACGFLPDGSRLVVFHSDGTVVWHDAGDGRELRRLKLAASPWSDVAALTPDGLRAVTGHDDLTARLWDLADGREVSRASLPAVPFGRPTFSPDGWLVALGGTAGQCAFWRLPKPGDLPSSDGGNPLTVPLVRSLNGTVADLAIGGGGRYVLLILKDRLQMAIFDVNVADITKRVPLASADVLVAAGADKAILVYPTLGFMHRYDLKSGELDKSVAWPLPGAASAISMGYDSGGPLIVAWSRSHDGSPLFSQRFSYSPAGRFLGVVSEAQSVRQSTRFSLLDLETLAVASIDSVRDSVTNLKHPSQQSWLFPLSIIGEASTMVAEDQISLRASAGGDLFCLWRPNTSPSGFQTVALRGSSVSTAYRREECGFLEPDVDGGSVLTESGGVRDRIGNLMPTAAAQPPPDALVPAIGAPFYLEVHGLPRRGPRGAIGAVSAVAHLGRGTTGEFALPVLDEMERPASIPGQKQIKILPSNMRLIWIPAADVLITIPSGDDRLMLRRLSVRDVVSRLKIDGAFLASAALLTARAGTTFHHPIEVVSRNKDLAFELIRGPGGLSIASNGTIHWEPPADLAGQETPVDVAVRYGSGRRLDFVLRILVQ
jgi:WD40 repeat protein/S1-C subfamily serine protease